MSNIENADAGTPVTVPTLDTPDQMRMRMSLLANDLQVLSSRIFRSSGCRARRPRRKSSPESRIEA